MGAAARALTAFEVPVAGRGRALAGCQDVAVHAQAHRASGRPPFEAGLGEMLVQPLLLGLRLHQRRAGNDAGAAPRGALCCRGPPGGAAPGSRPLPFVQEPMKTASTEMSLMAVPGLRF